MTINTHLSIQQLINAYHTTSHTHIHVTHTHTHVVQCADLHAIHHCLQVSNNTTYTQDYNLDILSKRYIHGVAAVSVLSEDRLQEARLLVDVEGIPVVSRFGRGAGKVPPDQ
jgi:hypothetical protein